jgi:hypothetical protein
MRKRHRAGAGPRSEGVRSAMPQDPPPLLSLDPLHPLPPDLFPPRSSDPPPPPPPDFFPARSSDPTPPPLEQPLVGPPEPPPTMPPQAQPELAPSHHPGQEPLPVERTQLPEGHVESALDWATEVLARLWKSMRSRNGTSRPTSARERSARSGNATEPSPSAQTAGDGGLLDRLVALEERTAAALERVGSVLADLTQTIKATKWPDGAPVPQGMVRSIQQATAVPPETQERTATGLEERLDQALEDLRDELAALGELTSRTGAGDRSAKGSEGRDERV